MLSGRERALVVALELFVGIGAIYGGVSLFTDAEGFGIEESWLDGTPFTDYTVPGSVLLVIGVGMLGAALLAVIGSRLAAHAALVMGVVQLCFLVVETLVIGYQGGQQAVLVAVIAVSASILAVIGGRALRRRRDDPEGAGVGRRLPLAVAAAATLGQVSSASATRPAWARGPTERDAGSPHAPALAGEEEAVPAPVRAAQAGRPAQAGEASDLPGRAVGEHARAAHRDRVAGAARACLAPDVQRGSRPVEIAGRLGLRTQAAEDVAAKRSRGASVWREIGAEDVARRHLEELRAGGVRRRGQGAGREDRGGAH